MMNLICSVTSLDSEPCLVIVSVFRDLGNKPLYAREAKVFLPAPAESRSTL